MSKQWMHIAVASVSIASLQSYVMAQTSASVLVPETFEPDSQRSAPAVTVARDPGVEPPPGSESLFIRVGRVEIVGAFDEMAEANQALRDQLEGNRVPVSTLFRATGALEAAYAQAGFVLARVVLPRQQVVDGGTLRVVVVDGFVEAIDAERIPEPVRDRVNVLTEDLANEKGLKQGELERPLLLAGDTYGLALESTLTEGETPGGTVLVLDGEYQLWTWSLGLDNLADDDLGGFSLNGGFELNSALGLGEIFYGRFAGAPDDFFAEDPKYRVLALGSVFPLGRDGLTFNIEGTSSRTKPDDPDAPTISEFDRLSFRLYYPWIRTRSVNLASQLIFDRQSDEQSLLFGEQEVPIYDDELSVVRATLVASRAFESGAVLEADMVASQGIDVLGVRREGEGGTPLSRQGADATFSKLTVGLRYSRPLEGGLNFSFDSRAQSSFGDPLLSSEQFNPVGPAELSSFDSGGLSGDNGWVARFEVSRPETVNFGAFPVIANPYAFAAFGEVGLEQPTVFEESNVQASSLGVGLELFTDEQSAFRSGSLRLEYGRGERDDDIADDNRFNIIATRRF